jgi:hypothetical protein
VVLRDVIEHQVCAPVCYLIEYVVAHIAMCEITGRPHDSTSSVPQRIVVNPASLIMHARVIRILKRYEPPFVGQRLTVRDKLKYGRNNTQP